MDQQRSMMMSRSMMHSRSIMMRPATEASGGMMQYLCTLIFVLVLFWVTVVVVYYFVFLLDGTTNIFCSVPQNLATNLPVYIVPDTCTHFVVILDRVTVTGKVALDDDGIYEVRKLMQVYSASTPKMVMSIDYNAVDLASLSTDVDRLRSQKSFAGKLSGVEVRNVPLNLSDYDPITKALTKVKQDVSVISEVFIAFKPPYPWKHSSQIPVDITKLTSLLEKTTASTIFTHYIPTPGPKYDVGVPNPYSHLEGSLDRMKNDFKTTSITLCPSLFIGAYHFKDVGSNNMASSYEPIKICKAIGLAKPGQGIQANDDGIKVTIGTEAYGYDTKESMKKKVQLIKQYFPKCIYLEQISLDDVKCECHSRFFLAMTSLVRAYYP